MVLPLKLKLEVVLDQSASKISFFEIWAVEPSHHAKSSISTLLYDEGNLTRSVEVGLFLPSSQGMVPSWASLNGDAAKLLAKEMAHVCCRLTAAAYS